MTMSRTCIPTSTSPTRRWKDWRLHKKRRKVTFRVLGIDPGSQVTGYGVIEKTRSGLCHIAYGEIKPGKGATLSLCLQTIYDGLLETIRQSAPEALAIEEIFYGKNVKSLIRQGHVRGVAILAGKHMGIPVHADRPVEV